MQNTVKGLLAAASIVASTGALAFPVTLQSVSGQWVDPVGGSYVNGENTNEIWWGKSTGEGQSGYGFYGSSDLPTVITNSDAFVLGTMTHYNRPITHDAISGVSLEVLADFGTLPDVQETGPYSFVFEHNETPNNAPETGIEPWCLSMPLICGFKQLFGYDPTYTTYTGDVDDEIAILFDEAIESTEFTIGSQIYSLSLLGFEGNATALQTPENAETSIDLLARLNVRPVEVAEPGTVALFGLSLLGLGLARRRKA